MASSSTRLPPTTLTDPILSQSGPDGPSASDSTPGQAGLGDNTNPAGGPQPADVGNDTDTFVFPDPNSLAGTVVGDGGPESLVQAAAAAPPPAE